MNKQTNKRGKIKKLSKKRRFLLLLVLLTIALMFLSFFIDVKIILISIFCILLIGSYMIYKEKIGQELIVAFLIAFAITSYYTYEYTSFNLFLGKINLFPLIAWTFSLVVLREVYENVKIKNKLILVSLLYLLILFVLEYIGYYFLGIRLNWNYESIFGIGIMHAPIGMKIFYILAGPIYLLITDYLRIK